MDSSDVEGPHDRIEPCPRCGGSVKGEWQPAVRNILISGWLFICRNTSTHDAPYFWFRAPETKDPHESS